MQFTSSRASSLSKTSLKSKKSLKTTKPSENHKDHISRSKLNASTNTSKSSSSQKNNNTNNQNKKRKTYMLSQQAHVGHAGKLLSEEKSSANRTQSIDPDTESFTHSKCQSIPIYSILLYVSYSFV